MSEHEGARNLKLLLRDLPRNHKNQYSREASQTLLSNLFYILTGGKDEYMRLLFPDGSLQADAAEWNLSRAQGAVDGAEYTEAARGKPCGHVFQEGEPTYFCRTCSADNTCVLCMRCYESSDHEGHQVTVNTSKGTSGCCDCNDPEAWKRSLYCSIHSQTLDPQSLQTSHTAQVLPEEFRASIRAAISGALDYVCDVFSCSPEQIRPPKNEDVIREDERKCRLTKWYGETAEPEEDGEFVLMLWNDEKHSVDEVQESVARATKGRRSFGMDRARQVDEIGRSVVSKSRNVAELIRQATILLQIKVTVTIRSARDTFREEMCSTIIDWLNDIAGCSVGTDNHILMNTICDELLKPWNVGSNAINLGIARGGYVDQQKSDDRLERKRRTQNAIAVEARMHAWRAQARRGREDMQATAAANRDDIENDDEDLDGQDVEDDGFDGDEDLMDLDDDMILTIGEDVTQVAAIAIGNVLTATNDADLGQSEESEAEVDDHNDLDLQVQTDPNLLFTTIPRRRGAPTNLTKPSAPSYWVSGQPLEQDRSTLFAHMDMTQRVRIDHLVFYDMRMWKTMRHSLRLLYISTVVAVPAFKRILSLRFAALYTHLAQLFFIADREAEHSIIYLSLQMLTTPSIAQEIVERTNFFTRLLAILYTFLTNRQVGNPEDVDPTARISLDTSAVTNRRFYHVFQDMGYLLEVESVREFIRTKHDYLLQFLDFAKIFQGICPSERAVGEHVEYESEAWVMAYHLNKEVTRLTRQFCDCFRWKRLQDPSNICRAIREAAKAATISSLGVEAVRLPDSDITAETRFKRVKKYSMVMNDDDCYKPIVDCRVSSCALLQAYVGTEGTNHLQIETTPMAFHHVLHYTLSWFIDAGKSMSRYQLADLLRFSQQRLQSQELRSTQRLKIPQYDPDQYLLAMFDIPVRVCAWAAQIRAGMWVRNGYTLRTQMEYYRGVAHRDVSHQRDLFMIQTAFVVCNPSRFLANVVERFGLTEWMHGYFALLPEGVEESQMVELLEELLQLLIVTLSDRTLLIPPEEQANSRTAIAKRDIIHALCFKPLTHSELTMRLPEKVFEMQDFEETLRDLAIYRPPEGLADSGTLVLKDNFYDDIDPYYTYYNKSQREEAESILRARIARQTGRSIEDVFVVPRLQQIRSGVFSDIASFSQTPLFAQLIISTLMYVFRVGRMADSPKGTRVEALFHVLLYLILIAVQEDKSKTADTSQSPSFLAHACSMELDSEDGKCSILSFLFLLLSSDKFKSSKSRTRFSLQQIMSARPDLFDAACREQYPGHMRPELLADSDTSASLDVSAKKKREALARQAKVMASFKTQQKAFMENQEFEWGEQAMTDSDDEIVVGPQLHSKTWDVPGGTCILCQEETGENKLYGTLAYVTVSRHFRQTPLEDSEYLMEVIENPPNLDGTEEVERPYGVASRNIQTVKKILPDGEFSNTKRSGLGKGFPATERTLNRGEVFSGCGHVMHFACFDEYCTAAARRHLQQHSRNHPERLDRKEFVCPLCKALGNAFMPVTWRPQEALDAHRIGQPINHAQSEHQIATFTSWVADCFEGRRKTSLRADNSPFAREQFSQVQLHRLRPSFMPLGARSIVIRELGDAHQRLTETIIKNTGGFGSNAQNNPQEAVHAARELVRSIGHSIAAAEIAQRGTGSSVGVFVDSLPMQVTTQLRTLSETASSYMMTVFGPSTPHSIELLHHWAHVHLKGMYCEDVAPGNRPGSLFLSVDSFNHLAESSYWLGHTSINDFYQYMRINYLAEILRVVVACVRSPQGIEEILKHGSLRDKIIKREHSSGISQLIQEVIHLHKEFIDEDDGREFCRLQVSENPTERAGFDLVVHTLVLQYARTFARKCALLLHVRFGLDFSDFRATDLDELDRLSKALQLPSAESIAQNVFSETKGGRCLYALTTGWLRQWLSFMDLQYKASQLDEHGHWKCQNNIDQVLDIKLAHPSIFELVALPETHDMLNAIAVSRHCPTTDGPLGDPCVCLLCGMIICGQSPCCIPRGSMEGGCTRHVSSCGGNVGMFLNIRKCGVLLMHHKTGSWFPAPYLDRHGETDWYLKRHQQLFLNVKRYDRLFREVWLGASGGISSAVARKLEGELNTGGWETI